MRKITDEGFLFLYGAGLLVTAETGMPAVITILFACIYTCVNLVGEEKYLHYIMTIAFVAAGIASKEMWMFLPVVLYNMLCFYSPVYIGAGGIIVACEAPAFREYYGLEKEMLIVAGLAAAVLLYGRTRRLNELEQEYKRVRDDSRELTLMLEKKNQDLLEKQDTEVYLATLKERNRIAREIHDNVGHMLSRSILMVGALKTILEAGGEVEVTGTGQDGKDAVRLYDELLPDVLLMDIRMKDMNGLDAAEQILKRHTDAKILLLTTFSDDAYIVKALKYGVKGYLIKQDYGSILPALQAVQMNQTVFGTEIMSRIPGLLQKEQKEKEQTFDWNSYGIGERELEITALVAEGLSNKEISEKVCLSEGTVRNYISNVLEKLELRDRTQLAVYYLQRGRKCDKNK